MKDMKRLLLAILGGAMLLGLQARATLFDIVFKGTDGTVAEAFVAAPEVDAGIYTATSGAITVDPGSTPFDAGIVPLFLNPNGINASYSPSGFFIYDNQVLPFFDPSVTYPGLLFRLDSGYEINLYSIGAGDYILYDNRSRHVSGTVTITDPPETLTSVIPEPTTMIAGAFLLVPFGMSVVRILRRNRKP